MHACVEHRALRFNPEFREYFAPLDNCIDH